MDRTRTHMWKPLLHAMAAGNLNIHAEQVDYLFEVGIARGDTQLGRELAGEVEFDTVVLLSRIAVVRVAVVETSHEKVRPQRTPQKVSCMLQIEKEPARVSRQ